MCLHASQTHVLRFFCFGFFFLVEIFDFFVNNAQFTEPQILLFSNFFIKNGFHDIIHTFKNYFTTVFFSFQFQFSIFSCIQMDLKSIIKPNMIAWCLWNRAAPELGYLNPTRVSRKPKIKPNRASNAVMERISCSLLVGTILPKANYMF